MRKTRISAALAALLAAIPVLLAACRENAPGQTEPTGGESPSGTVASSADETEKLPNGIPDKTFDGATIRFVTAAEEGNGVDVGISMEEADDRITEAVYKRDRAVEALLDVKLNVRTYSSYPEAYQGFRASVSTNSDDYDMAFITTGSAFSMANEGLLLDLSDYGCIDLDAPWWDQRVNEKHTVAGKLYLGVGSASVNDLLRTHMLLFNGNLFDDRGLEYPYADVLAGTWTLDKLAQYATDLNEDVNGDTAVTMDSTDLFGFSSYSWTSAYTLWYGAGGEVIGRDETGFPMVSINTEKTVAIYDKLYQTVVASGSNLVSDGNLYGAMYRSFTEGRVYITEACMMHLTHWPSFADMKDDYGIIPAPKFDEHQEDYISYAEIVEPALCIPVTVTASEELLSAVAEALAYEGHYTITPAVYETSLKGRFARDEQSKEMLDIIRDGRTSCLASVFIPDTSLVTSLPVLLQNGSQEIASVLASFETVMTEGLAAALEGFRS